jgi:N-acetylglutamate synthase
VPKRTRSSFDAAAIDRAAEAWADIKESFATTVYDGFSRSGRHGTRLIFPRLPIPQLNMVFSTSRHPHPEEIHELGRLAQPESWPWHILVRTEDREPKIEQVAARLGLIHRSAKPFLMTALRSDVPPVEDGAPVHVLTGAHSEHYRTLLAEGFEVPPALFDDLCIPALLDHPDVTVYVANDDSGPVATVLTFALDEHVGLFNLAVPPKHRRRGHARSVWIRALQDAVTAGAHTAIWDSTAAGLPFYKSLGADVVETWTSFSTTESPVK